MVSLQAQHTTTYTDAWFSLSSIYSFNEKWSLANEAHWRSTHFLGNKEQFLLRPSVSYQANKNKRFTLGYTFIQSNPYGEGALAISVPEHNIWEQIILSYSINQHTLLHRLRLEQRFLGQPTALSKDQYQIASYQFSNRIRYRMAWKASITTKCFMHLYEELWIATAADFSQPRYDRNWFYLGVGQRLTESGTIELAYLHQNIAKSTEDYERHPTVQLNFHYQLSKKNGNWRSGFVIDVGFSEGEWSKVRKHLS